MMFVICDKMSDGAMNYTVGTVDAMGNKLITDAVANNPPSATRHTITHVEISYDESVEGKHGIEEMLEVARRLIG